MSGQAQLFRYSRHQSVVREQNGKLQVLLEGYSLPKKVSLFCPFQACVAFYVTERMDGGCVRCLPACLLVVEKGREEEGSTAFACTLASIPPPRRRRSLARAPPPFCFAGLSSSSASSPFLLCTCVSAPGVCGRTKSHRRGGCNNTR